MMRETEFLLVLFAFFLIAHSIRIEPKPKLSDEDIFHSYLQQHDLHFPTDEERAKRFQIFQNNLHFIRTHHNNEFTIGLNKFAHLSREEYSSQYRKKSTAKIQKPKRSTAGGRYLCPPTLPQSVDYRGKVSPVEDQGKLGDDFVVATLSSLSDGIQVRNGSIPPALSQQNLIDCADPYTDDYFEWIQKNNGVDTEASYPTHTIQPEECKFNPKTVGVHLPWYQDVISGNETDLACAIAGVGPTVVAVDASQSSFQFYAGGVYYDPSCSSSQLDHTMVAVGYGSNGRSQFWVVKNSWGKDWGMRGYILMAKNKNNNCGIATDATVPFAVPV